MISLQVLQIIVGIMSLQEIGRFQSFALPLLVRLSIHDASSSVARSISAIRASAQECDSLLPLQFQCGIQGHLLVATPQSELGSKIDSGLSA